MKIRYITFNGLKSRVSYPVLIALIIMGLNGGCSSYEASEPNISDLEIQFGATIEQNSEIETRASQYVTDVTNTAFPDVDFYIYMEGKDAFDNNQNKLGTYWVQSSTQGMLWPKTPDQRLKWFSRDNDHYFWSWTIPWVDRNTYQATSEPVTLHFRNTFIQDSENPEGYWDNGACLEQFVGAVAGPYSYNKDGIYVPIEYRHMVSKIQLTTFSVVDNATSSSYSNLKGNFTILGMPDEVTFYPHPADGENGEKTEPHISFGDNFIYDTSRGVSFAVQNKRAGSTSSSSTIPYDYFYICPEMDFSQLAFKIELYERVADPESSSGYKWVLDTSHGNRGAFYGDFRNVTFTRPTYNQNIYDDPNGGDSKILHAGEYMQLVVSISSQGVPSVKVTVSSWTSNAEHQAVQHIKPGIYSDGEARDLSDMFNPASSHSQDEIDEFFELYGDGKTSSSPDMEDYYPGMEPGKGIFRLYEDITLYNGPLYVGDDYILDGMGHLIDFGKSTNYRYKISKNLRNVYLKTEYWYETSDVDRWYIIYIDDEGDIYKVNPHTWEKTKTSYSLKNATYNPVEIYLTSGSYSKP